MLLLLLLRLLLLVSLLVAGRYTILNDVTARDVQKLHQQVGVLLLPSLFLCPY